MCLTISVTSLELLGRAGGEGEIAKKRPEKPVRPLAGARRSGGALRLAAA